jgi:heterodisulfide reductase subunit A-like polyferredoxin
MKFLCVLSTCLLFLNTVQAAESGFMYQGAKYIVYKDGKKVGKTYEELFMDSKREPSSKMTSAYLSMVSYEEDELARCYRANGGDTSSIFCVKKQ